jgi:hypothetical protein
LAHLAVNFFVLAPGFSMLAADLAHLSAGFPRLTV